MRQFFCEKKPSSIPIYIYTSETFPQWLEKQDSLTRNWLMTTGFAGLPKHIALIPNAEGEFKKIIYIKEKTSFDHGACIAAKVPAHKTYYLASSDKEEEFALSWALACYSFDRYKSKEPILFPQLAFKNKRITDITNAVFKVRDWINMPACDLTPKRLARLAQDIAHTQNATYTLYEGEELARQFPLVHAVGKASENAPCFVEIKWGNPQHPKVTLVGKGVTFDTGGLDIKGAGHMEIMKKDMGGAAHALALGELLMQSQLPVYLRMLLPLAENSISGNSYRPGDILQSRKGINIEVGNTDAEGRLLLADALTAASEESPDFIIDFATLTGAARVAVGTDISALFCNQDDFQQSLVTCGKKTKDLVWPLPLQNMHSKELETNIADIRSCGTSSYAGASVAASFLQKFVPDHIPWAHLDMMAWNTIASPGRPKGGEAMGLRAVFDWLCQL